MKSFVITNLLVLGMQCIYAQESTLYDKALKESEDLYKKAIQGSKRLYEQYLKDDAKKAKNFMSNISKIQSARE